jgi:hypothetical protein
VTALPESGAPDGRRDFAMCWTGKEAIVWGGHAGTDASATEYRVASDGAAYDPRARRWRPLAPHPTPGVMYAGLCAWTGEDLVIAVARSGSVELWAYHPTRDRWRRIESFGQVARP